MVLYTILDSSLDRWVFLVQDVIYLEQRSNILRQHHLNNRLNFYYMK